MICLVNTQLVKFQPFSAANSGHFDWPRAYRKRRLYRDKLTAIADN